VGVENRQAEKTGDGNNTGKKFTGGPISRRGGKRSNCGNSTKFSVPGKHVRWPYNRGVKNTGTFLKGHSLKHLRLGIKRGGKTSELC